MSKPKVYIASSWRNDLYESVCEIFRLNGFEVLDWRGDAGFSWREVDPDWQRWDFDQYKAGLKAAPARRGFTRDMRLLTEADCCVLLLPCGKSAHLEMGWAIGQRKRTAIIIPERQEPELMYAMAGAVFETAQPAAFFLWKELRRDAEAGIGCIEAPGTFCQLPYPESQECQEHNHDERSRLAALLATPTITARPLEGPEVRTPLTIALSDNGIAIQNWTTAIQSLNTLAWTLRNWRKCTDRETKRARLKLGLEAFWNTVYYARRALGHDTDTANLIPLP